MMINEITAAAGAHRRRTRVGRGPGSGLGKTSGRGHKGAGSRAGYGGRVLNEGGALPLFRRLPIRGFSNARFTTVYQVVNVGRLERVFADGEDVTADSLEGKGLITKAKGPFKVLGGGKLSKKLNVTADAVSESAAQKITAAGGQVTDLSGGLEARAKVRARAEAQAAKAAAAEAAKAEKKQKPAKKPKAEKQQDQAEGGSPAKSE